MVNLIPYQLVALLLVLVTPLVSSNEIRFETGVELKWADFSYQEKDSHKTLLKEAGPLTGISASITSYLNNRFWLKLQGERLTGTNNYQGQTQLGLPLATNTEQQFKRYQLTVGWQMNALGLYTGFSSNHWHRDIQATKSTRQLTEIYSWLDASLGAYYAFNLNDSGKLIVEADLNRSISPQVEIVLTALGVGSPNLELEEKLGFRLATRYCYAITSQLKWEAGFSYRYYQFGRSDTLQLSSGNRLFSIHEPESHSALLSLQTGVRWVF